MADFNDEELARAVRIAAIRLEMVEREVRELRPFHRAFVLLEAVIAHGHIVAGEAPDILAGLERAGKQLTQKISVASEPAKSRADFHMKPADTAGYTAK